MKNLSETIDRKFEEVIDIDDYEILTDQGWSDIKSIGKTIQYDVWELKTETHTLKCADNHIVFNENMEEIFVKDLTINDYIQTDKGLEKVISVEKLDLSDNMYDISVNDENHRYYTDGILSHNSTIYCIYALWLACFHSDKRIMMLAQAESTALELLDRIKTGYEYLPSFLKPACEEWNKKSVRFTNRSTIQAFASSSNGPRGQSMNCCSAWTFVTIRFKRFKWLKLKLPMWLLRIFN